MDAPPAVEITRPAPEDALPWAHAHVAIWREAYADLLPAALLEGLDAEGSVPARREIADRLDAEGPGPDLPDTVIARCADGTVAGMCTAGLRRDDLPTELELHALNVAAPWRGTGLAERLVEAVLPPGPASLWVLEGNDRAIAFYRRLGFEETSRRKELVHRTVGDTGVWEIAMVRPV
ncbi:Ribosomal protein S18 acetylase RimI [Kytococcus aerolatus]|uniref:Ribosomal protein S18 acetylase RimI n=1 Tax=Kytococcus aerolatus TaxID=592308 RepID=A0A212U661_9MICO|nr:GNAT family N-acetyltransferase [Kytococcus aerolatus]SNC73717.1 Ribosomal protein S18 acetylase RimI [Kytococcus aerolatus]